VREQNARILISQIRDTIHLEALELSAPNEIIIDIFGRVKRAFPDPGIAIDFQTFRCPGLQVIMSQIFARMSHQSVQGIKTKVNKAGQLHNEDRDTTNPMMITEFLTSILRLRNIDVKIHKFTRTLAIK